MKSSAFELLGYYLGFVAPLAQSWPPAERAPANSGSDSVDRYETCPDYRQPSEHLVQIGVIALDYREEPVSSATGGRLPPGPARVIASIG